MEHSGAQTALRAHSKEADGPFWGAIGLWGLLSLELDGAEVAQSCLHGGEALRARTHASSCLELDASRASAGDRGHRDQVGELHGAGLHSLACLELSVVIGSEDSEHGASVAVLSSCVFDHDFHGMPSVSGRLFRPLNP